QIGAGRQGQQEDRGQLVSVHQGEVPPLHQPDGEPVQRPRTPQATALCALGIETRELLEKGGEEGPLTASDTRIVPQPASAWSHWSPAPRGLSGKRWSGAYSPMASAYAG